MNHLIIGASGYIGKAISLRFDEKGEKTIGTSFTQKSDELIYVDIENKQSVDELIAHIKVELSRLDSIIFTHSALEKDILQNLKKHHQLETYNQEILNRYVHVNTVIPLQIIGELLPLLKRSQRANIIFTGSLIGKKALNAPLAFSLGKAAVGGLVETLSKDLGCYNILVNSVDPGILEGGMGNYTCQEDKKSYLTHCALKRFGTSEEVANMFYWLATKNTFITGKPFVLDGGL